MIRSRVGTATLLGVAVLAGPLSGQVAFGHHARVLRIEAGLVAEGEEGLRYTLFERMEHHNVPGVSVAVMEGGVIAWAKAYGVKDARSHEPVTPETLFQAASISKPVSALAVLKLVERGELDLDRDVNDYLTTWKVPGNEWTESEPVTLRRILSHTAGLTQHGFPGYDRGGAFPSLIDVLDGAEGANTGPVRVDGPPGSQWRYSGGGYTVLQQLLEDVTGRPFADLLRELVLEPARMTVSTFEQPLPFERWDAAARAHDGDGEVIDGDWHVYPEMAAAGLWTTPFDLLNLASDVQRVWAGNVSGVLTPPTVREMLTPVPDANGYGLGFTTGEGPAARFGHGGANAGFRALLTAFVSQGRGVAVMTNGDRGGALAEEILRAVAAEYDWPDGTRP